MTKKPTTTKRKKHPRIDEIKTHPIKLYKTLIDCEGCPLSARRLHAPERRFVVLGHGDPRSKIVFVGEAPGADEERTGIPFKGKAGELLNELLEEVGLERENVFVSNVCKCRPCKSISADGANLNRAPKSAEAKSCIKYLKSELATVRPAAIMALGGTALTWLIDKSHRGIKIADARERIAKGKYFDCVLDPDIKVFCTYHPAYLLPHRSADPDDAKRLRKMVLKDLKTIINYVRDQKGKKISRSQNFLDLA